MSKGLEFGPDRNFKPRKPLQAVKSSGSQLGRVCPRGEVKQPWKAGKHEKPTQNSFQPSFSHFSSFSSPFPPSSCLSSNKGKACDYSEAGRRSRSGAAAQEEPWGSGQKDVLGRELGRLELQRPWAWLRAALQTGATRAGSSPSQTRALGLGSFQEEKR